MSDEESTRTGHELAPPGRGGVHLFLVSRAVVGYPGGARQGGVRVALHAVHGLACEARYPPSRLALSWLVGRGQERGIAGVGVDHHGGKFVPLCKQFPSAACLHSLREADLVAVPSPVRQLVPSLAPQAARNGVPPCRRLDLDGLAALAGLQYNGVHLSPLRGYSTTASASRPCMDPDHLLQRPERHARPRLVDRPVLDTLLPYMGGRPFLPSFISTAPLHTMRPVAVVAVAQLRRAACLRLSLAASMLARAPPPHTTGALEVRIIKSRQNEMAIRPRIMPLWHRFDRMDIQHDAGQGRTKAWHGAAHARAEAYADPPDAIVPESLAPMSRYMSTRSSSASAPAPVLWMDSRPGLAESKDSWTVNLLNPIFS